MPIEDVPVSSIRTDGGTQMRAAIDPEVVAEYRKAYESKVEMPPISLIFDGLEYWLVDGFHRLQALIAAGFTGATARVERGTMDDAQWQACAANAHHGLRRTNADKRKAITRALALRPGMSDREIAMHCGVDQKTVYAYRSDPNRQPKNEFAHLASTERERPDMRKDTYQDVAKVGPDMTAGAYTDHDDPKPVRQRPVQESELVIDAVGRAVPGNLAAEFSEGRAFAKQWLSDLGTLMGQLSAQTETKLGRSLSAARIKQCNEQLRYLVREQLMPHAICPMCTARGCKACHDRGWHTEETWRTIPEEMRTPRAKKEHKPF